MKPGFCGDDNGDTATHSHNEALGSEEQGERRVIDLHSRRALLVAVAEAPAKDQAEDVLPPFLRQIALNKRNVTPRPARMHARRRTSEQKKQDAQRNDAGRHFLKHFLPIVPVMMFVLGFLYWYLALDIRGAAPATSVDAMIPLLGACLLGLFSALLCGIAYLGYLKVRDRELAALAMRTRQGLQNR